MKLWASATFAQFKRRMNLKFWKWTESVLLVWGVGGWVDRGEGADMENVGFISNVSLRSSGKTYDREHGCCFVQGGLWEHFCIVCALFSIKHDLARSCFQKMVHNRRRGWKNTWRNPSRDNYFSKLCHPRNMRTIIENMILPNYVLCYM